MVIKSANDLFIHLLSDVNSAEKQITRALPKLARAADNDQLVEAFKKHLEETRGQVERLEKVADTIPDIRIKRTKCYVMESLIEESQELIDNAEKGPVLDAGLIGAAQKVEHYEIDHIDHELLLKALDHHCSESWVLLYVRRWLTAPMQTKDGKQERRNVGTPQGGPLSPVLANLFLHYALDRWLTVRHPDIPFCRYADDGILRCRSEREAQYLHSQLDMREVDPIAIRRDTQQTSLPAGVCRGCSDKSPSAPC